MTTLTGIPNIEQAAKIDIHLSMVANELYDSVEKGRFIKAFDIISEDEFPACESLAYNLLEQINANLSNAKYLVTDVPSIADIAVFSTLIYIDEAGFSTENYGCIPASDNMLLI